MKISELLREQEGQEVTKVAPNEIKLRDRQSGIETTVPKKPNQPGTITRDEEGNLVLDTETPGDVVDDIEVGDEVIPSTRTQSTQGTQGTR